MSIQMNLMLIIVAILILYKMIRGYKQGMVKEIISCVSLLVMCVVVVLIGAGIHSYMDKQIIGVVTAILLLTLVGIAHHLLGVVFFSAKVIAKLPVISWLDKLLGMLVGALEIVILLWTIYVFMSYFNLGKIEDIIMGYTNQSELLQTIYQYNMLSPLVANVVSELTVK